MLDPRVIPIILLGVCLTSLCRNVADSYVSLSFTLLISSWKSLLVVIPVGYTVLLAPLNILIEL
jgi:hypothetical protein